MKPSPQLSALATAMVLWLAAPAAGAASAWEVTLADGDLFLLPDEAVDWRVASPSDPLRAGDRLWAAPAGRGAVAGPAGLRLRLDHQTEVEVVSLASRQRLSLLRGALYVKHPSLAREGLDFELVTGQATLRSEGPAIMRVELQDDGIAAVTVYKGEIRVMTPSDHAWITAGEQTRVTRTAVVETPRSITAAQRDDFDEWNEAQELRLARGAGVDEESEPDLARLDDYGRWVSVASYGRVWRPWVAVGWRPYFYGQWLWVAPHGWSWVAAEPWGWLPHHYGQWVWDAYYGWVWLPGSQWAPAWVIWTPYLGGWAWAPYGPYGVSIGLLPLTVQVNYWCWSSQLGTGGDHHHRRVTAEAPVVTLPPGAHALKKLQPPRSAPSVQRPHGEQVARLERRPATDRPAVSPAAPVGERRPPAARPPVERAVKPVRSTVMPRAETRAPVERRPQSTPATPPVARSPGPQKAPVVGRVDRPARVDSPRPPDAPRPADSPRHADAPRMNGPMDNQPAGRSLLLRR